MKEKIEITNIIRKIPKVLLNLIILKLGLMNKDTIAIVITSKEENRLQKPVCFQIFIEVLRVWRIRLS